MEEDKIVECSETPHENSNFQMLEIKNVTKIYKTKGGSDTKALNDVSISFGQTGLVFLLGKSGSGKSTLLNVSGGLDEPTSGEIIVKGKSSKNFTGSDFDSYRNTFVGFIFQEYNILDEFNVEDNIALALELQGKPKDKEKINSLLKAVELEAYAKRKPNTLSGGQKQRIAIARALVKEPQIIMADEPTGALDSNTGKQVFDTLKKLSETRLVIVVSHDREFAEIYGDRIIELADGKIISDVTKTHIPPEDIDENISVIGGNTLSIKSGTKLSKENIKAIQDFISKTESDVIITNGEKEISSFKKINRMSESGATETFKDTPENAVVHKDYTEEESKFIRSRLPAAKAIKIGASGLKLKPVRLIFTIFLSVISFIMFGLFSTLMLYNGNHVLVNSFKESDYSFVDFEKGYLMHVNNPRLANGNYAYSLPLRFTEKDLQFFKDKFGDDVIAYRSANATVGNVTIANKYKDYYINSVSKFTSIPEGHSLRNTIQGTYPQNDKEICISSYMLEVLKENTVYPVNLNDSGSVEVDSSSELTVNSAQDIIGKNLVLSLGGKYNLFKVTGVFNCGAVPEKFNVIKEGKNNNFLTQMEFNSFLSEGTVSAVFTSESFFETYASAFSYSNDRYIDPFDYVTQDVWTQAVLSDYNPETDEWEDKDIDDVVSVRNVLAYEDNKDFTTYLFGKASNFEENSVLFSVKEIYYTLNIFKKPILNYYMERASGDNFDKYASASNSFDGLSSDLSIFVHGSYIDDETHSWQDATEKMRWEALDRVKEVFDNIGPLQMQFKIDDIKTVSFKLAGFYYLDDLDAHSNTGIILGKKFISDNFEITERYNDRTETTAYVYEKGQIYQGLLVSYDRSEKRIVDMLSIVGEENARDNDVIFELNNSLYNSVETVNGLVDSLSVVFLWVGIVLAVFSALLLFNFISVSISNKRKEIGILRAVGARGLDVFKIFFAESGIIVGICTIIALVGSIIACGLINNILKAEVGLAVTLFVFGPASIAMLIGIALLVAVVSTFLPVFFASRKKPVESIRAL